MDGLILDILLAAVVLLFAVLGARKGLVLSFCSLVAILVGLLGGSIVSNQLTPPLAGQAAPMLEGFLRDQLASGALALSGGEGFLARIAGELYASRDWLLSATDFTYELSFAVAEAVIRPLVFLLAFVAVLILWYFISHALDLVAHLPILSALNSLGGFLFGAVKGALILMVAALILRAFFPDQIPTEAVETSRLLALLEQAPPLF